MHLVCPHCSTVNRLAESRLGDDPQCGRCSRGLLPGEPFALDAESFERHLTRGDAPLLVDFWAEWCGPCKAMAPQFAAAAASSRGRLNFGKVDTERHPELAGRLGIRSIPTLVLFQGGRELARVSGTMPAADLLLWAQRALAAQPRASA